MEGKQDFIDTTDFSKQYGDWAAGEQAYRQAMERHAERTARAATFIAWVVGILATLSLIGAIIAGVQLAKASSDSVNPVTSTCMSQGGSDPSC